ncbi:MAG: dihydrofolate reductase, partial [Lacrimispora sphenoides]
VTYIDYMYSADTHFPNLDQDLTWEMAAESDEQTYFDLCYTYRMYQRNS